MPVQIPFDLKIPPIPPPQKQNLITVKTPLWTQNKAKFIQRYLYYFIQITKHGTYIDAFAGPQTGKDDDEGGWSAQLALQLEPRWLRHFYLFEAKRSQIKILEELKSSQPPTIAKGGLKRTIEIFSGDVNVELPRFLSTRPIKPKEATFCLLDQRTFECDWATVRDLAEYPKVERKIELFYFLANGWIDRALSAKKDVAALRKWWGADNWSEFKKTKGTDRAELVCERFRSEFSYQSANHYPIYEKKGGSRIMYFMIHASDHPDAPVLMRRAYHKAVTPLEPQKQLELELKELLQNAASA